MIKAKSLIGLSVVGQGDGTQIGKVRDLIFDHETDQVLALVIADKDLFGLMDAQVVPWAQIRSVGSDVILAVSAASKVKLGDMARGQAQGEARGEARGEAQGEALRAAANRETSMSGTQIMTAQGQKLGTLADFFIDEASGRVVGYEVSGGFVSDSLRGKTFLPAPPGLMVGQDAAIATPAAAAQLQEQKKK